MDFDKKAEEIQSSFEDDGWVASCLHRRLHDFLAKYIFSKLFTCFGGIYLQHELNLSPGMNGMELQKCKRSVYKGIYASEGWDCQVQNYKCCPKALFVVRSVHIYVLVIF